MQVNVEKLSPVLVEIQVQVPADKVRSEVDKAYAELARTAKIRGFRPGKAPRDVLAHIYGGRVQADVAQRLVDETFNQALADKQVTPLSQPNFLKGELRPAEAFSYKVRFEVRPDIGAVNWEGLEAKRPSTVVTDAMVDGELQRIRREHSTLQSPAEERGAKAGDVATLSYTLDIEGAKSQGPQELDTELGDGTLMKELEEALTGMRPGEQKDVELTFPDRHPSAPGKKGTFHLTMKDLRERIFPDIDDELAKDAGEDNLDKLRETIKARLGKELQERATNEVAQQLAIELCKQNPIPVPPSMVDQLAAQNEREWVAQARRMGQRIDQGAELRARARADAEMKVRTALIMGEIARTQQVQVVDEDIEQAYTELAEQTGKNVAKIKAEYRDPKKRETLFHMILEDKILTIVEKAAKITDL